MNRDGSPSASDIVNPNTGQRERAFFLWADIPRLRQYASQFGTNLGGYLDGYNLMSFETVEDVERFVEEHRDFYTWVVVNPKLGLRSGMEPFESLTDMARKLAVEE